MWKKHEFSVKILTILLLITSIFLFLALCIHKFIIKHTLHMKLSSHEFFKNLFTGNHMEKIMWIHCTCICIECTDIYDELCYVHLRYLCNLRLSQCPRLAVRKGGFKYHFLVKEVAGHGICTHEASEE